MSNNNMRFLEFIDGVTKDDCALLRQKGAAYGDSWKRRGGVGAFMMLARKWDRIENISRDKFNWDIFAACESDVGVEGMIEQIGDLRRYLTLIEAEMRSRKTKVRKTKKSRKPRKG